MVGDGQKGSFSWVQGPESMLRRREKVIVWHVCIYRVIVNECYKNKQVTCNKYQQFCIVTCLDILSMSGHLLLIPIWPQFYYYSLFMIYLPWSQFFHFRFALPLLKDQTKWVILKVRKSDLSKRLDGRIKPNFSMIRRDITGTSFLYESPLSPRDSNESHRLKPQKPGGKGPVTVNADYRRLTFLG